MEYKLNKIDTEIRQKIQDTTKEGFIHSKQQVLINKDKKKQGNQSFKNSLKKFAKKDDGKKICIDAEMVEEVEVEAFIKEEEKNNALSGRFLDIKR